MDNGLTNLRGLASLWYRTSNYSSRKDVKFARAALEKDCQDCCNCWEAVVEHRFGRNSLWLWLQWKPTGMPSCSLAEIRMFPVSARASRSQSQSFRGTNCLLLHIPIRQFCVCTVPQVSNRIHDSKATQWHEELVNRLQISLCDAHRQNTTHRALQASKYEDTACISLPTSATETTKKENITVAPVCKCRHDGRRFEKSEYLTRHADILQYDNVCTIVIPRYPWKKHSKNGCDKHVKARTTNSKKSQAVPKTVFRPKTNTQTNTPRMAGFEHTVSTLRNGLSGPI